MTIKAVRVYHDRGLLPEPERDSSGYRRYDADHAIQLVKIRTLVQAGVPLARIRAMLAAGPEEFAVAIAEIDRALNERAEELRRTRERIAQLHSGDRLFVSANVAGYLDELRRAGVGERSIRLERDLWILLQSVAPEQAAAWATDKLDAGTDPEYRAIYVEYDAAFDWSPDDPRLFPLARRTRDWFAARDPGEQAEAPADPAAAHLAAVTAGAASPAWSRIAELASRLP
ncbi:MerR family transcriptional regulator [Actinoplanes solisilvae]|uniref:MerR family transcriptional regulator n=1 Tax=Actinoplanes solisilvae TaxID=2486853 RepID=UPI000FD6FE81|nr:MerR family transcriptional regulator [Actinoplanes solisilvae]